MSKLATRRQAIRAYLSERYGHNSEKLIEALERIAFGKGVTVETDIPGVGRTLTPTISEMHNAIMDLLAYQHGRPRQGIDVEVDDKRPRWSPEKLTFEELQSMDRLARKASGQIVDATLVDLPELPKGTK